MDGAKLYRWIDCWKVVVLRNWWVEGWLDRRKGWWMHRVMEKGIIRVNWTDVDGWMKGCLSKVNGCIAMEKEVTMGNRMDGWMDGGMTAWMGWWVLVVHTVKFAVLIILIDYLFCWTCHIFSLSWSLLLSCEATRNYNTHVLAVFHSDTSFFLWSGWLSSSAVESLN